MPTTLRWEPGPGLTVERRAELMGPGGPVEVVEEEVPGTRTRYSPRPLVALAAEAEGGGGHAAPAQVGDKCMWTLVRHGAGVAEFQQYVVADLAKAAGGLVCGATSVRVTLQEPNAFSGAAVRVGEADRRVDAVLQITSSGSYAATDLVNSVLSGICGHVQGWRVHPTTIHDASPPVPLGTPAPFKQFLWINQRLDGTTPEFYSRNWYIHGGHPEGQEAETEQGRANRATQEEISKGRWYIQNRVLEPITPTAWVVNGFADLTGHTFLPGPGERYKPKAEMGEESFDRWPPRLIQGSSWRLL